MGDFIIYLLVTIAYIAVFALIFSLPIMWLWNWLMPVIFGLTEITWLQALGLSVLSGFFFGGGYKS
jgi:hypothetical protein